MTRVSIDVSAIPAALTGAGHYVMEVAAGLSRRAAEDLDVVLVSRRDDAARWRATGLDVVAAAPSARPIRMAWEQLGLPRRLRALDVDVHHAPHYTMPERSRVPTVVTIHDMTFFDHPQWHESTKVPVFRRAITRAASKGAALVCVSETTAQRFRDRFPDAAPTHVVPHGVDHNRFQPTGDAYTGAGEYVLFVGTVEPRKDVAGLIAAFDAIAGDHPDLSLLIAGGKGWGDPGVERALAAARHADRVQQLGYVEEEQKPALLRGAAAFAYPSRDEGFGLPVLEALACGAPVVTTAGTAMEEVAGDAAVYAPPGDVSALASALAQALITDTARRQRGLDRAARYTWDASANGHAAVYRSVG